MNMNLLAKIGKAVVNYAGPVSEGIIKAADALEKQKQNQTIAELVAKVAELEAKIK